MTITKTDIEPKDYQHQNLSFPPTWESMEFDQEIPVIQMGDGDNRKENSFILGKVMDKYLVYRHFVVSEDKIEELYRYVFFKNYIMKEHRNHTREAISADLISQLEIKDFSSKEGAHACEAAYEQFKSNVDITNKSAMLRIMPYIRHDYPKMSFKPFLEVYIKTRSSDAKLEGVPQKILRELYGRKHTTFSAVRIDKSLSVVAGEKRCKYIYLKEQTRAYFDENNIYYFVNNVATGFWQRKDTKRLFEFEQELKERLIDKELFRNTCAERVAELAIASNSITGSKIIYESLVAQVVFLSAEQAAKTNSHLLKLIMNEIYKKRIGDPETPLPKIIGITGPQLKYLRSIRLPDSLKDFRECILDQQFISHFPDIKKRIFAASVYLCISEHRYRFDNRNTAKTDIFDASQTICSLEKVVGDKRYQLADEFIDYLGMRKTYLEKTREMRSDDPLWQEIKAFGDPPVNIKPSRIHDQHNKIGTLINLMTQKKTIEDYDKYIRERKEQEAQEIEYTDGKYSIIMPEDAKDIIREGRILHHCVGHGGYIQAMARKECRILFLRDNLKISEPLITIEERNNTIRQCYGTCDSINTNPEIRDFITEFADKRGWEIKAKIYSDGNEKRMPYANHPQGGMEGFLTQNEINALLAGLIQ